MISSRTKKQLLVFVFLTLVGVSYVGAKYARLDRAIYDSTYEVNSDFAQSGGIFTGAEVTYRGVTVGKVSDMKLTKSGVNVVLSIDKSFDKIPADTLAMVNNKSAIGEQYVELEPKVDSGPYLKNGSTIDTPDTRTPISTRELLTNLSNLVESVPQDSLRTVVSELGTAFKGTGKDLGQIIDTSTSFIQTANANFDTTTALIRDSNTVLRTQADKASAIRAFSRDLSLFSGTLAAKDATIRKLIDDGSATATELRTFLEENQVDLGRLIGNLVTTGQVTVKHLNGIRQLLVIYPYAVAGGYTVSAPNGRGSYDAHFGLVLTMTPPNCTQGYDPKEKRSPLNTEDRPMDEDAGCTEAITKGNARGAQNIPNRTGVAYRSPVATYDATTGSVTWTDQKTGPTVVDNGGSSDLFGQDAWKWMLLRPSMGNQE